MTDLSSDSDTGDIEGEPSQTPIAHRIAGDYLDAFVEMRVRHDSDVGDPSLTTQVTVKGRIVEIWSSLGTDGAVGDVTLDFGAGPLLLDSADAVALGQELTRAGLRAAGHTERMG